MEIQEVNGLYNDAQDSDDGQLALKMEIHSNINLIESQENSLNISSSSYGKNGHISEEEKHQNKSSKLLIFF
jgi:hypothetical protein